MLLSLLVLGGAIALFRLTRHTHDEIVKIVGNLFGLTLLVISLVLAPWVLKLSIVLLVLTLPNCMRSRVKPAVVCPQLCIARGRCHTPEPHCFGWMRSPLRWNSRHRPYIQKENPMTVLLTDIAELRLRTFVRASDAANSTTRGVRLSVNDGGCSGYEYSLGIVQAPKTDDVVVQQGSLNIYVDRQSAPLLEGVVVDYVDSLLESGFKFTNPNATDTCGCGKSFQAGDCTPAATPCS